MTIKINLRMVNTDEWINEKIQESLFCWATFDAGLAGSENKHIIHLQFKFELNSFNSQ